MYLFKGEIIIKLQKFGEVINFFLENHWARIAHMYMKAFWHSAYLNLYKSWSPKIRMGDARGKLFLHLYIEKNLSKWNIWQI
jgi:hypothetical protein